MPLLEIEINQTHCVSASVRLDEPAPSRSISTPLPSTHPWLMVRQGAQLCLQVQRSKAAKAQELLAKRSQNQEK